MEKHYKFYHIYKKKMWWLLSTLPAIWTLYNKVPEYDPIVIKRSYFARWNNWREHIWQINCLKVLLSITSGGSRIFQMGGRCFVANGGAHILFSGKKCMKLKEIGLKWGGARLLAPCYSKITIFLWIILNSIMKTSYFTYFENNLLKRPPGSLGAMVLLQNCSFDT